MKCGNRTDVHEFSRGGILESLEARTLLSGDVAAVVVNGNLLIKGDDLDNQIALTQQTDPVTSAVQVVVTGTGTTINGQGAPAVLDGVTGAVLMFLKGGNDEVDVTDMTLPSCLAIDGGTGNNLVQLTGDTVAGTLAIRDGVGQSTVAIDSTSVGKDTFIARGAGRFGGAFDPMGGAFNGLTGVVRGLMRMGPRGMKIAAGLTSAVRGSAARDSTSSSTVTLTGDTFTGGLNVVNLAGLGSLTMDNSTVGGRMVVSNFSGDTTTVLTNSSVGSSAGRPWIQSFVLTNGHGTDIVTMDQMTFASNVSILDGSGDGTVDITDTTVGRSLLVDAGWGADDLTVSGLTVTGDTILYGGWGIDTVTIDSSELDGRFTVDTSWGADSVTISNTTVGRDANLYTGAGDDTVQIDNSDFQGRFNLDTGSGNDTVNIAADGDEAGQPATFERTVRINLGWGDDVLTIGAVAGTGNSAAFEQAVIFNGGPGSDTLNKPAGVNTFAVTPVVLNFETVNN